MNDRSRIPNTARAAGGGMVWRRVAEHAAWCPRDSMGEVVFGGRMWMLGGYTPVRLNDVWCSQDGANWSQLVGRAAWRERNLPCALVFNDQMWLFGGFHTSKTDPCNDVWSSTDGVTWTGHQAPWPTRHEPGCLVHDGKLWLFGGYGSVLYNDVWVHEKPG